MAQSVSLFYQRNVKSKIEAYAINKASVGEHLVKEVPSLGTIVGYHHWVPSLGTIMGKIIGYHNGVQSWATIAPFIYMTLNRFALHCAQVCSFVL